MTILITGGAKCGKSRIAEDYIARYGKGCTKYYIATMENSGEEAEKAIARHREMRKGKGFETIEKSVDIHEISLEKGCAVLLECVPTLTANEMFSNPDKFNENPCGKIIDGAERLSKSAELLVLVTNDVGQDGIDYSPETNAYIKALGRINQHLAEIADIVVEAVYGIPLVLKGDLK